MELLRHRSGKPFRQIRCAWGIFACVLRSFANRNGPFRQKPKKQLPAEARSCLLVRPAQLTNLIPRLLVGPPRPGRQAAPSIRPGDRT